MGYVRGLRERRGRVTDRWVADTRADLAYADAKTLERAAEILRMRSRTPVPFGLAVVIKVLDKTAHQIRATAKQAGA